MLRVFYRMWLDKTARSVLRDRLTYLAPQRFFNIQQELRRIKANEVPGDFIEFGIALGGSSIFLAKHLDDKRSFHGFDVFGMIPAPSSEKDDVHSKARYEVIKSGHSKGLGNNLYYGYRDNLFEEVCQQFAAYGIAVNGGSVALHKGLFEETWPAASQRIDRIAFAHVDCDWYDPVRYCLLAVADKIVSGGAIIVDDYNDYGGCRTATDEFLSERQEFRKEKNFGNLVIRKV